MIDGMSVPEDWGVADKKICMPAEVLSGSGGMPALEGRDVIGFSEFSSINFAVGQMKQQPAHAGRKQPEMVRRCDPGFRGEGGKCVPEGTSSPPSSPAQRMVKGFDRAAAAGNIPDERKVKEDREKRETLPKPKEEIRPKLVKKPIETKKSSRSAEEASVTLQHANSQREAFLKERGRDPAMYIDTQMAGLGKQRTTIRKYVERELNDDPNLKESVIGALEFMSLWVDGNGKRISGDTIKEGKTSQDVKQFSLEYRLNSDGSVSQTDPSAEGEQRAFRNYSELESILNGPIKKALLAAGLTEEDLSEHPPQKPVLTGLNKEQKNRVNKEYKEKLSAYNERESRREKLAENLSQMVMQEHLQAVERQNFGSPLDTFKKLSPEEQDKATDLIYKLLPATLKQRFDKVGSPRSNIFGGYEIKDGKKMPIYADKITHIRGKGMLKKYLIQGGIDGYTHDQTIMGPYTLTLDHVLPSAKGGGDHPDNGVFTRGGLNTHLSANSFLWLYRSALGEKERLGQLSDNPEEQKRLYNDAQSAAYKSQFGTSVALSQAGTGKKLSKSALNNSRGNLTGDLKKDLRMISKSVFDSDLQEANATSLDSSSAEMQEFVKKQTLKILGISYFGTGSPNAAQPTEKSMSSSMQNLLWGGIVSKLKEGQSFDEINDSISDIKNTLAAALLSGTQAGGRYLSRTAEGSDQNTEGLFRMGIEKLSKFMRRSVSTEEIKMIRSQL